MKSVFLVAAVSITLAITLAEAQIDDYPICQSDSMTNDSGLSDYDQTRQILAQQMLDRAIEAFALDPTTAMAQIQDTANPLYHDGELYVFMLDINGTIVAHGITPDLVGVNTYSLIDIQGTNIGDILNESRSPYGKWAEYWWPNPATETNDPEIKITWTKTYGNYQFAVGMYPGTTSMVKLDDVDGQTKRIIYQMVDNAIDAFVADKDSAIAAIQDPTNSLYHDGELYVFVHSHAGKIVAHGATPELVGGDSYSLTDTQGTNLGELILDNRSSYGKWYEYWWPNPATETDEEERKVAWVKSHAGHIFGVGTHPDAGLVQRVALSMEDKERQEVAWQMATNAAEAFEADPTSAINAIQDPDNNLYHDKELYVTVLDSDAVIVAHGVSPNLVGTDLFALNDTRGTNFGGLFIENHSPYDKWVEYWWPNPTTISDEGELKVVIMVDRGEHTFTVGTYPKMEGTCMIDTDESEKRRIAKAMVEKAIAAYSKDPVSANKAIADTTNPLYHDGELYVFVVHMNGTMVAHGVTPGLGDGSIYDLVDVQGTNIGDLLMEHPSPYGQWLEYWWPNPATETDEAERKISWAKSSSGYVFVVGLYP